jgi:hypothetical protein
MKASAVDKNDDQFNDLVNAFSMRNFVPGAESAHDHFFNSFDKFTAVDSQHSGEFIAVLARRAVQQNESYLELMALSGGSVSELGQKAGWNDDFQSMLQNIQSLGLDERVTALQKHLDQIELVRQKELGCAAEPNSEACQVRIRYVYQVLRLASKEAVFAQTMAGFMLAAKDPRVVAINFVQAEDGVNSMTNYHVEMRMIDYAKKLYPKVHITLHAGELVPSLVPPEGLRFHIREAVEIGHAERIGHGVDIMYETGAEQLLREMRDKHIAVEINLTSNDVILGVRGLDHPFPVYRKYGVPVVISTDDEGINRSHLTLEYQRAVLTFNLGYADVKKIVRNSLEYSFLPGSSYWADATYRQPVKACVAGLSSRTCAEFAASNEKAAAQVDLEKRFQKFESGVPGQ